MGKSMYNFGKQTKEKARQSKQMEKVAKRLLAKEQKAAIRIPSKNVSLDIDEAGLLVQTDKVAV